MKFSWKLLDYVLLGIAFNSAVCLFLSLFLYFERWKSPRRINSSSKVEVREKVRDIVGILNL